MKYALLTLTLTGCIFEPETRHKPDRIITVGCDYDHVDSTGASVWICPVNDSSDVKPPKAPN